MQRYKVKEKFKVNFILDRTRQYLKLIQGSIYSGETPIEDILYYPYKDKPTDPDWIKFIDGKWGGYDEWAWFKTDFNIPIEFKDKAVVLKLVTGPDNQWNADNPQFEAYIDGKAVQAFDTNHYYMHLTEKSQGNEKFSIEFFGYSARKHKLMDFKPMLYTIDYDAERLYYNIFVALRAAEMYPMDNDYRINIEKYITNTLNLLDMRGLPCEEIPVEYKESVKIANEYIEKEFYGGYCKRNDNIVNCVGHTHIDVAWQWTIEQTRQKAVRSFSTALMLMDRYPEFKFMSSQPQLYQYVKEEQPEMFERIKQRVKEGRWEIDGAMWLEADCNLINGESFIRQLVQGKKFIKDEFDVDSKMLWLPDVFGYAASMPQILKKSGIDTFVTSKISWNEFNPMPHQTFNWRGIDGTEIFTQFIMGGYATETLNNKEKWFQTYTGQIYPNSLQYAWEHYKDKNINNEIMSTIGFGDGGGGVTEEMLQCYRRMKNGIPGTPTVNWITAKEAVSNIKENIKDKKVPVWSGELYLELHRGTYTSMAKNKKFNRKSEFLLSSLETAAVSAEVLGNKSIGSFYKKDDIYSLWRTVLLNQFHDIIPGSSIEDVYKDSDKDYANVLEKGNELFDNSLKYIGDNVNKKGVLIYNSSPYNMSGLVNFEDKEYYVKDVPAFGWKVIDADEADSGKTVTASVEKNLSYMENDFYLINFDNNGNITRLYDKINDREVLKNGYKGNVIQAFDDHPKFCDNWEISNYFEEKTWEVSEAESVKVTAVDNHKASIEVVRSFSKSKIKQVITIYAENPRIDFENDIDWQDHHVLLKAAFPVDVVADNATYEIQFGTVQRPTHKNTSWDEARFEVCAQKWADLSEDGYGVSLLNDCKYGYDIHDGVMRITLLRAGTEPNPNADMGRHTFTYSIMPHDGDWRQAETVRHGFELNQPLKAFKASGNGNISAEFSAACATDNNIVITAVKYAEDNDDIIIRAYEAYGRRTKTVINTGFVFDKVFESDLTEENIIEEITEENIVKADTDNGIHKDGFKTEFKPYEIKAFRIKYK